MPKRSDTYPTVPAELKALHQWVLLKEEQRDGKPTKIPYQVDGNRAIANDPNTWTNFQTVCNHRDRFSDIGFVFSKDDPYCGIYIHNAINVTGWHGYFSRWAQPLCYKLCAVSYGETSSSHNGSAKFWTRAKLPDWMNRGKSLSAVDGQGLWFGPAEIEVYHYGRYFTVTGRNQITGEGTGEIKDGQAVIDSIVDLIEWRARKDMEEESDEVCDKCNSKMVFKWGRYGRFLGCSNFPECRNIKRLTEGDAPTASEEEPTDENCDKCGSPMVIKTSRAGGKFLACTGYPQCKVMRWVAKNQRR